jgi:DNA-binding transcriptional LysR family regulator
VAQAVEAAKQVHAGAAGTLRVAIGKGLGDVVSRIINGYLRLFPGVEVDVKNVASGFQSEAFENRRIDVGFMRPPSATLNSRPAFCLRKVFPLSFENPAS